MKRILKTVLIVLFAIFILVSMFFTVRRIISGEVFDVLLPKGRVSVDENLIDNASNNHNLSYGDLLISNNKLYYNYKGDNVNYGTYEIDQYGSHRIQWYGVVLKRPWLESLEAFKGELLLDKITSTGAIHRYSIDNRSEESFTTLKNAKKNKYRTFDIIDGKMYVFSKDKIYLSTDGVNTEEIFETRNVVGNSVDDKILSISGTNIVYASKDGYIKKYNYKTQQTVFNKKIKVPKENRKLENVILCGDDILLVYCFDTFYYEVYNATDDFKMIYSKKYQIVSNLGSCFNAVGNELFVSAAEDGIYRVDVNTGKTKQIIKGDTREVIIFGDKWIYFIVGEEQALYRAAHDGKTIEKVFEGHWQLKEIEFGVWRLELAFCHSLYF